MKKLLSVCILLISMAVVALSLAAAAVAAGKPAWQEDWDKTVLEAQKEGKLLIYTSHAPNIRSSLTKSFKNKFGIDIEFVAGRGAETVAKIFAERRAGIYTGDIYIGGTTPQVMDLKPKGALIPLKPLLILPEVIDSSAYFDSEMPWVDNERQYILTYGLAVANTIAVNAELVKPGEIKGYTDLLKPKWKDKIALQDPTVAGTSDVWFYVTSMVSMTPDYHRQLIRQNPAITRDKRLQVEWVAKKKYHIALAPAQQSVGEFQKAGAPLKWVPPAEGTYLSPVGSLSCFDRAPHPNAAKVFANWLLTREGLTAWSKVALVQTVRKDVPVDFLLPESRRDPKVKYFNTAREDTRAKLGASTALAKEIYGPLLK